MDSQWLLSKRNNKDLKFDTKSKNNNNIISAIINVISILHMDLSDNKKGGYCIYDSIDNIVDDVDVKIATSILTGKIQL